MSIGRGFCWGARYRGHENVARGEQMCYPYVGVDGLGYYRRLDIVLLVWKRGGDMGNGRLYYCLRPRGIARGVDDF